MRGMDSPFAGVCNTPCKAVKRCFSRPLFDPGMRFLRGSFPQEIHVVSIFGGPLTYARNLHLSANHKRRHIVSLAEAFSL